jgi:hypothetical protein
MSVIRRPRNCVRVEVETRLSGQNGRAKGYSVSIMHFGTSRIRVPRAFTPRELVYGRR